MRVVRLPALNKEELDELRIAIKERFDGLGKARALAEQGAPHVVPLVDHRAKVLLSVQTAVLEALVEARRLDDLDEANK